MSSSTTEIFNVDVVKGTIEAVGDDFNSLSTVIQTVNSKVADALGSPDKAMYGDAGKKVLATWDENCSTLNEFIKIFGNWSSMVVSIGNNYGNLQEGTAIVQDADKEAFNIIANNTKSSWLKSSSAKDAYQSPENTNTDNSDLNRAKETLKASYIKQYNEMIEKKEKRQAEIKEQKVSTSSYAIEPHSGINNEERARRLQIVGGETGSKAEQDSKMVTINVPYWDGNQESTFQLTVNNAIADNYINVFKELTALKYTVKPSCTAAYDYYHTPRPSGAPSDHTLGTAIDINWDNNWNTGDGSSYSVRGKEDVINAFAKQGFYWGGDWRSSKDDMHFSFTGF